MISENIKKQAGKQYKSGDWWINALINELIQYQRKNINESDTNFIIPGDLVFFMYSAKYAKKYKFWDQAPLSLLCNCRHLIEEKLLKICWTLKFFPQ